MRRTEIAINPAWLVEGDHSFGGGCDAAKKILALSERPTAIMCSNDLTAIGVQHALFRAGFNMPDGFSVIGFDDVQMAEYTIPPLTTIRVLWRELARAAVQILVFRSTSPECRKESRAQVRIGTRLVVRRSTARPKAAGPIATEAFVQQR